MYFLIKEQGKGSHTFPFHLIGKEGAMLKGTVKWFKDYVGYGYIVRDDNQEAVFVYQMVIQGKSFKTLHKGDKVLFELVTGAKGPQAVNVMRLQA